MTRKLMLLPLAYVTMKTCKRDDRVKHRGLYEHSCN